ncbi:MAG TPA: ABC transporter ATP-binding protein [Pyrinomonadaceae bacterium]|nr:ABC transporter ATP-binding protein [Pyrinomonadaceae bacterium]HMP66936.1 ABC transporter ATP-binding protein [Pyrinomonadaceae bacterium]
MLEVKNIRKTFGDTVANDDVSIAVRAGTIHAIVGENGAGKSTIMRIVYGFYSADSGEIVLDGRPVSINNPQDAIKLGIGMVHQHFMLVDTMTVAENIILGAETGSAANLDLEKAKKEIVQLSEELKLGVDPEALIEDLSVGAQQRVELLKALFRDAKLLILDEPTAVLSPQEVEEFFGILRKMKAQGKTIVIITHKLEEVLAISDEVTVMRDGRTVGNLQTAETNTAELARMIVGRDVLLRVEKTDAEPDGAVLSVEDLKVEGGHGMAVDGLSLVVRAGEIVGIAGIEGNGQTELIEALAGLRATSGGSILFEGEDVTGYSARKLKELGIGHIPEDRHKRGLLLDFELTENSILGIHYREPVSAGGFIKKEVVSARTREIINDFDVRPPRPELTARSLSGGNQQKLIIGREFVLEPKLLLVSQPTRGVDIGAIEFIHRKLIELRDRGAAVLLVSAELEEVTALADRLLVIRKGRIVGEVDPRSTTFERIGLLMTGG